MLRLHSTTICQLLLLGIVSNVVQAQDFGGALDDIPEACQGDTTNNAVDCFVENVDSCNLECSGTDAFLTNETSVNATCSDVESQFCTYLSCCRTCQTQFLNLFSCLYKEVNVNATAVPECTFVCPEPPGDPLDFLDGPGGIDAETGGGGGNDLGFLEIKECQESGIDWAFCFAKNACEAACADTMDDLSGTLSDTSSALSTGRSVACDEVEPDVCTFSECCPACKSKFTVWSSCLYTNLQQRGATTTTAEECDFDCGAAASAASTIQTKQGFIVSMLVAALALLF